MFWMFRNKLFLSLLCICISVLFAFVIAPKYETYINKTVEVVVLNRNIPVNMLISESTVTTRSMRLADIPSEAITDKSQVIGQYTGVPIFKDDFITKEKLVSQKSENSYLVQLKGEMTAVAISVPSLASALAGQIRPGDIVSVVAFNQREKLMIRFQELVLLEVADVVNADGQSIYQSTRSPFAAVASAVTKKDSVPSSVVLLCTLDQALKLVEIENQGTIHLIFRGRGETANKLMEVSSH